MAKKLQILRGTTAQNDAYTGSIGELTMDTEKVEVRIHDGTTQGGKTIGSGGGASLPILTHVFSDHKLEDMSWLNADTFSWQSGDVYVAAYNHLVEDFGKLYAWASGAGYYYTLTETPTVGDNVYSSNKNDEPSIIDKVDSGTITFADPRSGDQRVATRDATGDSTPFVLGVGLKTETISSTTVTYFQSEDGHKICMEGEEANIQALYEKTGVAWYYILDTKNKQFKLPRTKFGFTGLRDTVGGYVEAGLPNITGTFYGQQAALTSGGGAFFTGNNPYGGTVAAGSANNAMRFDASRSSSVYGNSNTVQPKATQAYLYFYVGNFEQSALEQTAGITSEQLNNKADASSVQALESRTDALEERDYVVASQMPTASNNNTWYRKYKSGWVEQGITVLVAGGDAVVITLPVPMSDINYNISLSQFNGDTSAPNLNRLSFYSQTATGFTVISRYANSNVARSFMWKVCGMAA